MKGGFLSEIFLIMATLLFDWTRLANRKSEVVSIIKKTVSAHVRVAVFLAIGNFRENYRTSNFLPTCNAVCQSNLCVR